MFLTVYVFCCAVAAVAFFDSRATDGRRHGEETVILQYDRDVAMLQLHNVITRETWPIMDIGDIGYRISDIGYRISDINRIGWACIMCMGRGGGRAAAAAPGLSSLIINEGLFYMYIILFFV